MPLMSHDHHSSQSSSSLHRLSETASEDYVSRSRSDTVSEVTEREVSQPVEPGTNSNNNQGEDNVVEVAEEATSEMAFQTLHQTASDSPSRRDSSSHESSPVPQEIPLEDLSRKHKSKKKQQITRARLTQSRLAAELKQQQESRSNSQSPKRKSNTNSVTKAKLRGRATSLTTEAQQGSRSRSSTPEKRHHSESSPLPTGSKTSHSHKSRQMKSTEIQTNLTLNTDVANENSSQSELGIPMGHSPKSLYLAKSPVVSLVQESEKNIQEKVKESPKLLPPSQKLRSSSDASQTSSDYDTSSLSSTKSSDSLEPPNFGLNVRTSVDPELSSASVTIETAGGNMSQDAASDQLARLAKIVHQYKFENEADAVMEDSKSVVDDTTG